MRLLISRIVGGQAIQQGEWPFLVGMVGDFMCGGTIITKNDVGDDFILTAAHCVEGMSTVKYAVGDWNQFASEANEFTVTGDVTMHPGMEFFFIY
ncbi:Oidioi.mRNA.OKI2018_I69.chr1.g3566.t1.cds [Oikopleura dioica]|uniref:Oidioi.mRNA.OKI2018_I69.chr1.g3566.t1.cds n=1 Tax=Oikopleura dioica TaxID=34765 RepID=A0ABN7SUH9_OIKDI|nr:Oidioi.mRNA.OKI2018_I69.chr1.g3566.t1.cds [Oikopleura dioica]